MIILSGSSRVPVARTGPFDDQAVSPPETRVQTVSDRGRIPPEAVGVLCCAGVRGRNVSKHGPIDVWPASSPVTSGTFCSPATPASFYAVSASRGCNLGSRGDNKPVQYLGLSQRVGEARSFFNQAFFGGAG